MNIPVVGLGGIATGRDALEFIMAGATAVQVLSLIHIWEALPRENRSQLLLEQEKERTDFYATQCLSLIHISAQNTQQSF